MNLCLSLIKSNNFLIFIGVPDTQKVWRHKEKDFERRNKPL